MAWDRDGKRKQSRSRRARESKLEKLTEETTQQRYRQPILARKWFGDDLRRVLVVWSESAFGVVLAVAVVRAVGKSEICSRQHNCGKNTVMRCGSK